MNSFFKSKNMAEATSQIFERLDLVPENLKSMVLTAILQYSKGSRSLKKYPMSVKCHALKPQFFLGDGDLLYGFALRKNGAIDESTQKTYMGSADSVLWHQTEQLSQGQSAPAGQIGIFITECAGGSGNRSWMVDVWVGQEKLIETTNDKNACMEYRQNA